jgi:hypothetical protein
MDPLSTVVSVIRIAARLKKWIDDTEEKNEVAKEISQYADRISLVLEALKDKITSVQDEFIKLLGPAIEQLGATLQKTFEHLQVWSPTQMHTSKKIIAFFSPATVTAIFQGHRNRIFQDMNVLLFTISTASYLGNHIPDILKNNQLKDISKPDPLKWVRNAEVRDFWAQQKFGDVLNLVYIN